MKKIDIHCHTTNRLINGVYPTLETILEFMAKHEIEKTVLLASYFPHKGTGVSNFRLLDWIRCYGQFCMFGSLDFDTFYYQGMNELAELAERRMIKGIKVYTCYQHIDLSSDRFLSLVALARENVLPMMFHVGYSYSCMSKTGKVAYTEAVSPRMLESVALANPGMCFIFSHMGKPYLDELIEVVNNCDNVYTDMSGLIDSSHEQNELAECVEGIRRFIGECGPRKLLFGTDFPVQTHEDSVYMIEEAMKHFSERDKEDVYYNNAYKILKLS